MSLRTVAACTACGPFKFLPFLFLALLGLATPNSAEAAVTVPAVSGASGVTLASPTSTSITVYGGTAGNVSDGTCANRTTSSVCSSCTDVHPEKACNEHRIHADLLLTISVTADKDGNLIITKDDTSQMSMVNASPRILKGQTGTVQIAWQTLCNAFTTPTLNGGGTPDPNNCIFDAQQSFKVGVDADNNQSLKDPVDSSLSFTAVVRNSIADHYHACYDQSGLNGPLIKAQAGDGICAFRMLAGDGQVYLQNTGRPDLFPVSGSGSPTINYVKARILCRQSDPLPAGASNADVKAKFQALAFRTSDTCSEIDITTTTDGSVLNDSSVAGLENDKTYYFKMAMVDAAGNIGQVTDDVETGLCDQRSVNGVTTADVLCHVATPGKITGLLANDKNCFIATAAFGSPLHEKVKILRQFRDQFLKPTLEGRLFVKSYYFLSPPIAHKIAKSETLKRATRSMLAPLIAFAELSLNWGIQSALLLVLLPIFILLGSVLVSHNWVGPIALSRRVLISLLILLTVVGATAQDEAPDEPPYTDVKEPGFKPDKPTSNAVKPYKIDKEGDYYYKKLPPDEKVYEKAPEEYNEYDPIDAKSTGAVGLRLGVFGPFEIQNEQNGVTYKQMYSDRPGPVVLVDYEQPLFKSMGHLSLKATTGVFATTGQGRFENPARPDFNEIRPEAFTFLVVPNSIEAVYKFQFAEKQLVVPYVDGGAGYYGFAEIRNDGKPPKFGGAAVGIFGGGLQILMDSWDHLSFSNIRREYGVDHVWLTLDAKQVTGINKQFDFSSRIYNIGFLMEF